MLAQVLAPEVSPDPSNASLSHLCVAGPDVKFKGVFHPLVISPSRVLDLFQVSQTPEGRDLWLRLPGASGFLLSVPVSLQAFGSGPGAACRSCSLCWPDWFCSFQRRRRNSSGL